MAYGLIALGSNLGDSAAQLRQAISELAHVPNTRVISRSRLHETPPIGGPKGQSQFLNAAALIGTSLTPPALLAALRHIEGRLGRTRHERWAARTIDLDFLLYDVAIVQAPGLVVPHPRMAYRRFVLEPAAEVAAWMVHPESAWNIGGLLEHLNHARQTIAVAAAQSAVADDVVSAAANRLNLSTPNSAASTGFNARPSIASWSDRHELAANARPKLLLGVVDSAGIDSRSRRRMLHLPPTGPIAWIDAGASLIDDAVAAIQSVWPALAT